MRCSAETNQPLGNSSLNIGGFEANRNGDVIRYRTCIAKNKIVGLCVCVCVCLMWVYGKQVWLKQPKNGVDKWIWTWAYLKMVILQPTLAFVQREHDDYINQWIWVHTSDKVNLMMLFVSTRPKVICILLLHVATFWGVLSLFHHSKSCEAVLLVCGNEKVSMRPLRESSQGQHPLDLHLCVCLQMGFSPVPMVFRPFSARDWYHLGPNPHFQTGTAKFPWYVTILHG